MWRILPASVMLTHAISGMVKNITPSRKNCRMDLYVYTGTAAFRWIWDTVDMFFYYAW
eukprot:TRINITY_DN1746_c0_g1_i1.p1 TRINITY_DN1746_c0_g1~~TRINITY_DN1746_c0_g1_i1.p1  ORF type:complete len:58 (-),score=0.63 TRINITY_DN1746_c0_g1_i1:117-290(-)